MATEQSITQTNAANANFTISDFSFIDSIDVKVSVTPSGGSTTLKDEGTHYNINGSVVEFTSGNLPPLNAVVRMYRNTVITSAKATYNAGSTIRADDLNNNQNQFLYSLEEKYSGVEIKTAYEAESNTNAYTDAEKTKLSGIATGAEVNVQSDWNASSGDAQVLNKPTIPTNNNQLTNGAGFTTNTGTVTSVTGTAPIVSSGGTTPAISISDDSITEVKLDIHNAPSGTDKVLGYTSNGLEWVSQSGGGIALSDISVTSNSAGTAALSYNNSSGVFSYTPPDLSGYSVTSHNHDSSYATSSHNHDSSYNNYTHPTTAGNIHIPSGGSAGQFLKYSASGTAVWAADNNTTYTVGDGGLTQNNFTNTLKTKLDGIETSADVTDATNVDSAGAIMNSDLDGKGELLVGDGSGDPTALAVGTNTHVLTADSNEASGVKWAANYAHPNHSGEVTSTGDGATEIANNIIDEANLKVSNSPVDGYFLQAQSSNTGGLTWAAASGGGSGISNIVEDTTPQLGGHLDCNGKHIKETQGGIGTTGAAGSITNSGATIQVVLTDSSTSSTYTLSFLSSNFPNGTSALYLVKNAANKTIAWSNVDWIGGTAPTISTTKYSAIEFVYVSNVSSNVIGCYLGDVG